MVPVRSTTKRRLAPSRTVTAPPECLVDVRARLDHGDTEGALAVVEGLLGPDAVLRNGALREELETAAQRMVAHGLFRAGLAGNGPGPARRDSRVSGVRPRHATR